ncbi:MAG TPA: aldehyde dehydrogenase family protein [Solirubrobacteraceae bacterium]|jgi:succinate-semialdehyde dehydrogenase/glutarate-semialdehyde dehydrogenase
MSSLSINSAVGTIVSRDPVSGEQLGHFAQTPPEEIGQIAAASANVQPLWALLRVADRARYMRRMAQAIIDEFDDLTEALAREQARPRSEIATLELLPAIDTLIWIAEAGARELGERRVAIHRSMSLTKRARVAYEPLGVVAVIGAGSAPFAQPLAQIAGALLAGNGVLFKPALRASLAGERIARVVARAGLPEGLVQLVHGGARLGVALADADVEKILFTGSPAVGRAVARACVSQNKEVVLETGGKDAMIVLADAHVPRTVSGAVWAGFAAAGQARGSIERIYLAREIAEQFLSALTARTRALRIGDPRDERVQLGPLASERRLLRVHELVQDAVVQGAHVLCGGEPRPQAGTQAAFYAPTVLAGATHEMRVMREPLDGPVLAVTVVDSASEAIALANDCDYALGASVWSADRYHALRISRELQVGMVWVNDHLPEPMIAQGPWGASAGGGLGHTLGQAGLRAFAQEKLITFDPPGRGGLWWGPQGPTLRRAAQAVAELRSGRDFHRERAWRRGAPSLARIALRALGPARG